MRSNLFLHMSVLQERISRRHTRHQVIGIFKKRLLYVREGQRRNATTALMMFVENYAKMGWMHAAKLSKIQLGVRTCCYNN